jgi:hypothetical protein
VRLVLGEHRVVAKSPEGSRRLDGGDYRSGPAWMRASSVVEFLGDPLDLCFQPAFALTPYVTTDDGCDVRHRFVAGNYRLVMHERVDDRGDQLGALVPSGCRVFAACSSPIDLRAPG